jgi:hypothetical protein
LRSGFWFENSFVEASWKRQEESRSANRRGCVRPNDSIVIARQLQTPKPTPPYQTTRQNRPEFGEALVGCHVIGMERVGSQ